MACILLYVTTPAMDLIAVRDPLHAGSNVPGALRRETALYGEGIKMATLASHSPHSFIKPNEMPILASIL